jgi:hypothetical protein
MSDAWLEAWSAALLEFPLDGTRRQQLRGLIQYAAHAPSSHNSQPWRFRLTDDALELYADRRRSLPAVDPAGRELVISCGAALAHLEIAARHFGIRAVVETFPDPADSDLLARISLDGPFEPSPRDEALFAAIPRRHTCREPFKPVPLPDDVVQSLVATAGEHGAWLERVTHPDHKERVAELVMEGDRIQMADPTFRRELASWLRPRPTTVHDGMPCGALGVEAVPGIALPLIIRTFDVGSGRAARDRELATESPALAVLGTPADTPRDWLAAGQALAHVLLLACDAGIRTSFLNQPIEVAPLRVKLAAQLARPGSPQLVLRLGYGPEGHWTPRRPTEELVD